MIPDEFEDGVDPSTIFRPIDVHVCKWDTDPRFMGSYVYPKVGLFNGNPSTW